MNNSEKIKPDQTVQSLNDKLLIAVKRGCTNTLRDLISSGVNIKAISKQGKTALRIAFENS